MPTADAKRDIRISRMPRFQGDNLARNLELVEGLRRLGEKLNATPAQLERRWHTSTASGSNA